NVQARLSFCTYFLLYPLVITLQDWSVNHVRNLKCQPCMEAAHIILGIPYLSMVFVLPTKITGGMNRLVLSLGGFSNCVLQTYSWLLHNGQQEIVFRVKGERKIQTQIISLGIDVSKI
ncbi:MAG: hypothetical protein WBF33_05235, partial [Candidatus Nitrosopolaris sp.]